MASHNCLIMASLSHNSHVVTQVNLSDLRPVNPRQVVVVRRRSEDAHPSMLPIFIFDHLLQDPLNVEGTPLHFSVYAVLGLTRHTLTV